MSAFRVALALAGFFTVLLLWVMVDAQWLFVSLLIVALFLTVVVFGSFLYYEWKRGVREMPAIAVSELHGVEIKKSGGGYASYLRALDRLGQSIEKGNLEEAHRLLFTVVRSFFSSSLGLDPNFTFEELEEEVRRRGLPIVCNPHLLSSLYYGERQLSRPALEALVLDLRAVITSIGGKD